MKSFTDLLLEGQTLLGTLKKEYPEVIHQIIGPRSPEDGENGFYRLQMIVVPFKEREKKLGTRFMKRFIELAKKENADITLSPSADYQEPGEMTKKDLTRWYRSLGFEKKHGDDFRTQDTMVLYN